MQTPTPESCTTGRAILLAAGLLFLLSTPSAARAESATDPAETAALAVPEVLASAQLPLPLPVFHDSDRAGVKIADLLAELPAVPGTGAPCPDCAFAAGGGRSMTWKAVSTDDGGYDLDPPENGAGVVYLAFYIASDRWQQATLKIETGQDVLAHFAGQALNLSDADTEDETTVKTADLTLPVGKHLVVLRTAYAPPGEEDEAATDKPWSLGLSLTPGKQAAEGSLVTTTAPERAADIQVVLNAPRVTGLDLSPDGKLAAISLRAYRDGENSESWLEVRDTEDGKLVHVWRGAGSPGRVVWSPQGRRLTWQVSEHGKSSLWYFDLDDLRSGLLLADVEDLGAWRWAPDAASIVYEINRTVEADERKVKRVQHPADRQPWWRNRSHLVQVFVPSGLTRRLTAGPVSAESWQISPDGDRLLFFLSEPNLEQRPYFTSELWLMDLETLAAQKVLGDRWIGGAVFGPDPNVLCLSGSPSAFNGLGRNLPDGMQANDYGGQLYLYDLKKKEATPVSLEFDPAIGGVEWSRADGKIYVTATDTQYRNVYRFDPDKRTWQKLDTGVEYTERFELPLDGRTALAHGTSAATPNRLFAVDLKKNRARLIYDPGEEAYRDIVFGQVETWICPLPDGRQLDGMVYYPPNFDPARRYPLIVYYYGGTSPVTRDFGGRYPKNIWAGQGYVVYVPEPSGATGYGQEFAARHVNDWGRLTADEVITATEVFLDTFDFADPEAVGCIGASYGGFLTEYIITRTNLFAAAVSHAGISSISSYWGEGLWGYAYGARALAGSFPWQDRDLYIDQSPLFHADKITTPLLMVHGDADVNVPVGESDQLFTALKMLGREVEYVQIQGQDHHILDHAQRMVWNDTILAFFAKYLKERAAWWEALYPEPKDYR